MTEVMDRAAADGALKARHRAMWASGDYPAVADRLIPALGPALVDALQIGPGDRVLDVAAGTGNAAVPAARTGATVTATDLTPQLLDLGRGELGNDLRLDWQTADAEALPFDDATFDVVMSCVGVMFAPHHQTAADELVRVCTPGGRIGVLSWTPAGFIGQMFAAMKPYAAPPPPGAQPPPLWGDEQHVRELLGDRVTEVRVRREALHVDMFAGPQAFLDFFKSSYGPTISAYRGLSDDPERTAALDRALTDLAQANGADTGTMQWEYLIVTALRV